MVVKPVCQVAFPLASEVNTLPNPAPLLILTVLLNVAAPVVVKAVRVDVPDAVKDVKLVAPVTPNVPPTVSLFVTLKLVRVDVPAVKEVKVVAPVTFTVDENVAAPPCAEVPESVVAPVTPNVLPTEAAPVIDVLAKVAAPVVVNVVSVEVPDAANVVNEPVLAVVEPTGVFCKLPAYTAPAIPAPPFTINAPVVVEVEVDEFEIVVIPLKVLAPAIVCVVDKSTKF